MGWDVSQSRTIHLSILLDWFYTQKVLLEPNLGNLSQVAGLDRGGGGIGLDL